MKTTIKTIVKVTLLLMSAKVSVLYAQTGQMNYPDDIDPESYSRLPLILKDTLDVEGQHIFEVINGPDSNVPRIGPPNSSLYALEPSEPYDVMNQLLRRSSVGPQMFELSTLVPAREFNQQYEWSAHERGAQRVGVDQAVIDVVKYNRSTAGLPAREALVIDYGRALLQGDHQISSEMFAAMVEMFGRQGTIEITMIMGDYTMTAMLLNAVNQQMPPDLSPLLPMPE